jgi:hypothetical protein
MIPREVVDQLRNYNDIAIGAFGIACTVYVPTSATYDSAEKLDVFSTPSDYSYNAYTAKVFIHWTPSIWKLKKLGLFVEGQTPILAYFPNKVAYADGSNEGDLVEVDIVQRSYIRIAPEFIPDDTEGVEEYEIVNVGTKNMQDAICVQIYSLVPRRVVQE